MKISLNWLGDFLTWRESDTAVIADRITMRVAEVDAVEVQGKLLDGCCLGEVLSIAPHPNADRLSLVEVKTDKGTKRVVCGGTNLKVGQKVAFAHIGARVRHGDELVTLQNVKIRGEASEGMICAAEELDLRDYFPSRPSDGERPIADLSVVRAKIGTPLREALGLTDTVLHISNTAITMRPDLFSHVGFARECVAIGLASWKKKPAAKFPRFPTTPLPFKMANEIPELVPRYCSCLLEVDAHGMTPNWMVQRLAAAGWRSVNLPVDITNYVATETGMPLHSFDADDIKEEVRLRLTREGERITTLDEVERPLPEGAIVLSDKQGIFDLLGIMGGLRSSTKDSTRRIFLHAAVVDPVRIRRAILATGHRTDAATVYEKGIPRVAALQGFARALELFLELVPGAKIVSKMDSWGDDGKPKTIKLHPERVRSVMGIELPEREIVRVLSDLECTVKTAGTKASAKSAAKSKAIAKSAKDTHRSLAVTPPLHRLRDLASEHDLIEEIVRIHGYEHIAPVMPEAALRIPEKDVAVHQIRDALAGDAFLEILPLSLVGPELLARAAVPAKDAVEIKNPLGATLSLLQPHSLPSLLEHAQRNLLHTDSSLQTFHWGHVFGRGRPERVEFGALIADKHDEGLLHDPFLRLKDSILQACDRAGYALELQPTTDVPPYAHPGRIGELHAQGQHVGLLFEVHPTVREHFDLPARAAACILDLSCLLNLPATVRKAKELPAFPSITYDLTIARSHKEPVASLLAKLRTMHPLLKDVHVHDLYAPSSLPSGQYNLTLRCTYRAPDRTLTEEEVKKAHEEVMRLVGATR